MNDNNQKLITKPIPGLIKQIAIPSSIGFLFNTLYNIVDTYFGGKISTEALAALSLSFPLFFIIIAVGQGMATGATALVTNSIGEGNMKTARKYAIQSISFSILIALILTVLGIFLAPEIFTLMGAKSHYLSLALEYTNTIFYGATFFLLSFMLNAILVSEGNAKTFRNLLVIGFFLNIILDPWFIYGGYGLPAFGLRGVALATVLIQIMTAVALAVKVWRTDIICKECLKMIKPKIKCYLEIAKQGFPASLNMLTIDIGIFIIIYFVGKYGSTAVAAYGLATKFDQMSLLPVIGINVATLALVGQNNGAKKNERVREIVKLSMRYGFYITTATALIVFIFSKQIITLFSADPSVISIGSNYLKISSLVYWAYAILYITVSILQGLKKPFYAIWIGIYRQLAIPLLIFWLITDIFKLKLTGLWWGIFIINWSAAVITWFYLKHTLKRQSDQNMYRT